MIIKSISRSFFILSIALMGFACKSNQTTAPNTVVILHDPGEFGYAYDGTSIDRKDYPGVLSYGAIAYSPNYNSPGHTLDISLMVQTSQAIETQVELSIPMTSAGTGKWDITVSGASGKASATLKLDTVYFGSVAGGTIEITEFDPIANLVSGTFSFDGAHNGTTEHVTSGYFNKIPIYYGTLNQGLITADISVNGSSESFNSTGSDPSPSLYTVDSGQTFIVIATADDGVTQREIDFGISNIRVGYADLNPNSGANWFGQYNAHGQSKASISTITGASGRITITDFNWLTHRMTASFYFSGFDNSTGNYVSVTNGQFNNVLWFDI